MRILAITLCLFACSKAKPEPAPSNPSSDVRSTWNTAQDRLIGMLDNGWVVSRGQDGSHDQGDSLIFSGIGLASLDCDHGSAIERALSEMVTKLNGGLWRHPSLSQDISGDGALGFYLGVAHRMAKCGETATWKPLLAMHRDFMAANGNRLNPGSPNKLPGPFPVVRDQVFALAGLGEAPDGLGVDELTNSMAIWAELIKKDKAGCFRVHLGLIAFQTMELAGRPIPYEGRQAFCAATAGMNLPTTDHFCGRPGLDTWISTYQPNLWAYRHQRCPTWESPDGAGREQPGIDLLRGLVDMYALN